jgi:hypothetical protein
LAGRIWFSAGGRVETLALLAVLGLVYVLPASWLGLAPTDRSAVLAAFKSVVSGSRPAPAGP